MHRSILSRGRNAKALAVLAAASSFAMTQIGSAQTWVNPNNSTWSAGANWVGGVAPTSGAATALTFNATGAQTYTATNNLGAFTLASMTFSQASSGALNVAGDALQSDAALTVTRTGAGTGVVSIANPFNTASAPATTAAGAVPTFAGDVSISGGTGGNNILALTVTSGTTTMTGGAWTVTSTLRRNDSLAADSGPWGLNIGESAGGGNFTQTGGTINGTQGMLNVGAPGSGVTGPTGTWAMTGGAATFGYGNASAALGRFGILQGTGTIAISGGATLAGRLFEVGRQGVAGSGADVFVSVTGTNSRILAHQIVTRAEGRGTINVSGGGLIDLSCVDATGTSGAGLMVLGSGASGPLQEAAPQVAVMNIGAGGTVRAVQPQIGSELGVATINVTGGGQYNPNFAPDLVGGPATAVFLGDADALDGSGTDNSSGFGAINVSGTGSLFNTASVAQGTFSTVIVMGGGGGATQGGDAVINVSSGGEVRTNDLTIGQDLGSNATLTVNGSTSTVNAVPNQAGTLSSIVMAGNVGSTGQMDINAGTVSTGNIFIGGGFADALGDPVPGGTATVNIASGARLNVASQFTMASVLSGVGQMNVNGGVVAVTGNSFTSPSDETTAVSTVNVSGGTMSMAGQFQVAGAGTIAGGASTVNITNGGLVTTTSAGTNGLVAVFAPGTINVGSGTNAGRFVVNGSDLAVDGRVNYNAGTLNVTGTLSVGGGSARVQLSSAGRLGDGTPTNKKTLDVGQLSLDDGASNIIGVVDLNDNDAIVRSQSRLAVEGLIANARNGGAWNQAGLTSSAAASQASQATTLGVIDGSDYIGLYGTDFNGRTVDASSRIVKYTWYGDTDFNGVVDFDDYVRLDGGFNGGLTGWFNGDFDLNGAVDFDDYVLIDLGFNSQNQTLGRMGEIFRLAGPDVAAIGSAIEEMGLTMADLTMSEKMALKHAGEYGQGYVNGFLSAVPEPGTVGVMAAMGLGALARRRRRA